MKENKTDKIIVKITSAIGIIIIVGITIWLFKYFFANYQYEETNDAQVDAYLSPVNVKIGGYIDTIYFKDNQKVRRGDTLVRIMVDEYELKRDAAAADLDNVKTKIGILNANEETQQRNIDVIEAKLSGAQARLDRQKMEYDRYKNLLREESTTRQKFETVQTEMLINQSNYDETIASLRAAKSKLNDLQAEKLAVNAEIKTKRAILARQQLDINYTVITAPFDGQIGKKTIQIGQLVQAGQNLAFLMNEDEEKWVVANFKETQVGKFQIGQKVKVIIDAFPDEVYWGTIESLSPTTGSRYSLLPPDNATGNFVKIVQRIPVRIKLDDEKNKLLKIAAGMNANVYIKK